MIGITYSFLLVLLFLLLALAMWKLGASPMVVRKVLHMGASNWWFLEMAYFPTLAIAMLGPIAFIILNALYVYFFQGESERKRNYGLIYFPISLLLLVIMQFKGGISTYACLVGVLSMGYGDSLAALIGKKWGKKKIGWVYMKEKSWLGCLVMFSVSFLVGMWVMRSIPGALLVGFVAMLCEVASPFGLDNITVPLLVTLVAGAFV